MATDSPMSNFNRKNPYVIQAKQQYNILMDLYEEVSKNFISRGVISITLLVIATILAFITKMNTYWILSIYFIAVILLTSYFVIKNTIKDAINSDIDTMVTLENNEILNISIEYVQDLLYKLHECIGKVKAFILWYRLVNDFMIITAASMVGYLIMEVL
mgnify:FL=1